MKNEDSYTVEIIVFFVFGVITLLKSSNGPKEIAMKFIALGICATIIIILIFLQIRRSKIMFKKIFKNDELTLEKIMDCIRKEGYYPQKQDDKYIVFKIQGKTIDIFYDADTQYCLLRKYYLVSNDNMLPAIEKAAFNTMAKIRLIKIYTQMEEENNLLFFSVEWYMSSFSNFEKSFFQIYMRILFDAVGLLSEYFNKISEEQVKDEAPRPKICFPASSSNIKS